MNEYPCPQYVPPALTQAAMDTLFASISSGTKEVQYADKKVVYQNVEDMFKIWRWMQAMLSPCGGGPVKVAAYYDSGLRSVDDCYPETSERFR